MVDAARLLAMLEPTVRPAGVPGPAGSRGTDSKLPIEQRSFESLLEEARKTEPMGVAGKAEGKSTDKLLAALGQLGAVENAGARKAQLGPEAR